MLVSVLLPVYNAAATLPVALESIRRQRHSEFECIAVDDGSSDASREVLERFARADPRFVVVASEHRGIVAALNAGLARCRGDYVARMDADDIMHSARLGAQSAWLAAHPELAGVGCHVRTFPRRALSERRLEYERWLNSLLTPEDVARDHWVECPLAHPTLLLRRELFQRFAYRDAGWPEDYDLLSRLREAGHTLGVVPRRLLCWRDSPERLSRRSPAYANERFTALKAHFLARGFLAHAERYVLWGYGDTGRALCKALFEHGRHPHAIVELHPRRIGQRIRGATVIPPERLPEWRRAGQAPLPIVVSVARREPREQVRAALRAFGCLELRDYVCAA